MSMKEERREGTRWWVWALSLFILTAIVLSVLSYVGVFTSTLVEREVFEQSYQRREGLRQEIAIYEAQIVEIEAQLINPNLEQSTRTNLQAQLAVINVRLNAARRQ